jgi:hypothetical protein
MKLGDILNKYRNGDVITDEELDYAIKKLNVVNPILLEIGEVMYYPAKELRNVTMSLEQMKRARKDVDKKPPTGCSDIR